MHRPLQRLLEAQSVAVVGASSNPGKITGRPIAYMLERGFRGKIFPVNPMRQEVQGLRCYPSLAAIDASIDLVIVGTDASNVEQAVAEGIAASVGGFVIFSSGFAELDANGAERQKRLRDMAQASGIPILGPNCLGLINSANGLVASFTTAMERNGLQPGGFGFVSQSGALGAYWLDMVLQAGIGFSSWITTGNECDVDVADALEYLVDDEATSAIGLYIEDVKDGAAFRKAVTRAASRRKPIFVIKAGRSAAGAAAAASHTGALAGQDTVYQAFFDQFGIGRVESLSEMLDAAMPFLCGAAPMGARMGIMSVSGGAGVMLADAMEGADLTVQPFGGETRSRLAEILPKFSKPQNPLDLTATVVQDTALFSRALTAIVNAPEIDAAVLFVGLMHSISADLVGALVEARAACGKPIILVWMGASEEVCERVRKAQIPMYPDIPQAVAALAAGRAVQRSWSRPPSLPIRAETGTSWRREVLSEWRSKETLRRLGAVGLPAGVLVEGKDQLERAAGTLGFPLVAKLQSPDMPHKTEHGGVALSLNSIVEAEAAVDRLLNRAGDMRIRCEGVLIEQMVPFDFEFLLGLRRDPIFGPMIVIGRGGIEVEVSPDVTRAFLPLERRQIEELVLSLRCAPLLGAFRGKPPIDVVALVDAMARLADAFVADHSLDEIEINPLVARRGGPVVALDALVTTRAR